MHFKRLFDILVSLLGLIVLFPLFLLIAIGVKFDSSGTIFFRQVRIGQYGQPFKMIKFRTMVHHAEQIGRSLTVGNDPRLTVSGRFLRQYKLDELPQLWNVLTGEMSLVGPRPELPKYVALYNNQQSRVLQVKPGITDFASIRFRHESELLAKVADAETHYIETILPEKLSLNLMYIDQANLGTDLKLILMTLKCIVWDDKIGGDESII